MQLFSSTSTLALISALAFTPNIQGRLVQAPARSDSPSARTIWQASSTPTWIENLAFRPSNGDILFGLVTEPSLYQLKDPLNQATAKLLYEFPDVTSVLGMSEIADDIFAVVVGNFTTTTVTATEGSFSLWKVDFANGNCGDGERPEISKITNIPEAMFLNGLTKAESHRHLKHEGQLATVLIADSVLGAVWKVNTSTGDYEMGISLPEMLPPTNASLDIGINGIAIYDSSLYWTNTASESIYAVPIDSSTCSILPNTTVRTVAEDIGIAVDDLTFDFNNNLYVAGGDTVVVFSDADDHSKSKLKPRTVVGSTKTMTVAGSTSVRFGGDVLYVTTDGGMAAPVNGTIVEAGKIVALQYLDV
ncbi:uncharacterized protein BHQ10_005526 [Talaromyces amestolkiae]|uniref:SMP-30/Gluconolactonase/LRE-like region domain-containing protein n=1 Tax=Talaromyces amestolkiae TaxID=1196081 RepID=A0A364L155_TALAM|nr:uncharacterized protein BHQ10_005526 [Talaromyces amestolkiae]RAO69514.1 hypothetical protein BHQ10_005526 [Talaromyces amestolkiae]